MPNDRTQGWNRRTFVRTGLCGAAATALPWGAPGLHGWLGISEGSRQPAIRAVVRDDTLFAGIRRPIASRAELEPRLESLRAACGGRVAGPLTHIFRYDTPVEGYDSELGYPVSEPVDANEVRTHRLRRMHFYSRRHEGPAETARETARELYAHMNRTGLAPELELVEVYHEQAATLAGSTGVEVMASYLAWPEVYLEQVTRVLGAGAAAEVYAGGERLTPHTLVDPRCEWVGGSIARLKPRTSPEQQFDILSRVALQRPPENVQPLVELYRRTGDLNEVLRAQQEKLAKTRTGGFVDPPRFDGRVLHVSKVPFDGAAYAAAKTPEERRRAYCFCTLVREAADPKVDPVFCYRAAGWARQLYEPVLGVEFERCTITHSILAGDPFCAWDYEMPEPVHGGAKQGRRTEPA